MDEKEIKAIFNKWIKKYCGPYVDPQEAEFCCGNMEVAFIEAAKIFGEIEKGDER